MKLKYALSLCLGVLAIFFLARLYYFLTDDFRHTNITYELPFNPEWETPLPDAQEREQLKAILEQPFTYLGKGAQVYAFGSEDGKYVLKFFKFKHIRPSFLIEWLPPIEFKQATIEKKKRKVYNVFKGYKIAFERDRIHTGLEYIHLNKTTNLHLTAHLVDKIGRQHTLNLDDTVFILQKRGVTLRTQLANDLNQQQRQAAEKHIYDLLAMYLQEYKKGIFDRDHGVPQNSGFIGETPFHLDVGKFSYSEAFKNPEFYEKDLVWVTLKIKIWLEKNYPQEAPHLVHFMQTTLSDWFQRPIDLKTAQRSLEQELGRL